MSLLSTGSGSPAAAPEVGGENGEGSPRLLPFVLGIVGDSGSGKSTIAHGVRALIGSDRVTDMRLDDYHRFTRAERAERGLTALNPMVHNLTLMQEHLQLLRRGRPIRNRSYDHSNGSFGPIRMIEPKDVVIVSGLLGFPNDKLRAAYDLAVFLCPEAELLYRWKLRRDVRSRGYKETEVLKHIAQHLLDSKEFVLPQAEHADLVVKYELPQWDAPDSEVRTSLIARRRAAEILQSGSPFERFGEQVRLERRGEEVVLHLGANLSLEDVDAWTQERFPASVGSDEVGAYLDDAGGITCRAQLMLIEAIIARLTELLRRFEAPAHV